MGNQCSISSPGLRLSFTVVTSLHSMFYSASNLSRLFAFCASYHVPLSTSGELSAVSETSELLKFELSLHHHARNATHMQVCR
jgi:hypothetical protein